jgi:hypothetical protein
MASEVSVRELDAAVAERVMGWRWVMWNGGRRHVLLPPDEVALYSPELVLDSHDPDISKTMGVPKYSIVWDAAGLVIEEMRRQGYRFELRSPGPGRIDWSAIFSREEDNLGIWMDGPGAICRAALNAKEAENANR